MQIIDNINKTVKDDLQKTIRKGSKLSVAAACFSIYAYKELKKQLEGIDELRFIFTSPTFTTEKASKAQREFYIPRITRERSLYGTEYEIKLRNELTQKAIAKECADWIKSKVTFKSNVTNEQMMGFMTVDESSYMPINGFTTVDLGCERGNYAYYPVSKIESYENTGYYINLFEQLWNDKKKLEEVTDVVLENITAAYRENSPQFIYFFTLYNIFNEFLEDVSEDELPNEATGFKQSKIWEMLYDFQRDAALAIINKLEKYNGCILADSVGLGKTFTALAVIKYYENRNKSVLVLCPKKLSENWNTFKGNYKNNPIVSDKLRYDVLFHTDLSRDFGESNSLNLELLNWGNYDLVVIDESHNFRNGGKITGDGDDEKENRYTKLLNKVIREGVKTKVLMLSATPVNNKFTDLKNQLALSYEGDAANINKKLATKKSIDEIFRQAQRAYNDWCEFPAGERTTDRLLRMLDFDFFELLDSVTIARSRKHIKKYYNTEEIGKFPERLPPISKRPSLTDHSDVINYDEIYEQLELLNLNIYMPSKYIHESKRLKYIEITKNRRTGLTQEGREEGICRLMSINLLKRLESSVYSFRLTVDRINNLIDETIKKIENYESGSGIFEFADFSESEDLDYDDLNTTVFSAGQKVKIDLADMDYKSWKRELLKDSEILKRLSGSIAGIDPRDDAKLQELFDLIEEKTENPINPGNKKILIFTAFTDTADYLYEHVSSYAKEIFGLETALITGTTEGKTTLPGVRANFNSVLTYFSPISKNKALIYPDDRKEIDILIATDCISEGQNLQDCDYVINYDIHWNPVRIIQRFGRIDRIGSRNDKIQLVNFWPNISLDAYINLKERVETRMKISILTAAGEANPLSAEEKEDLEYRRVQLERLQKEVVDIEDMAGGISIMDLGLNEFRLDLLEYIKHHPEIETAPKGLHAVVGQEEDAPAGVIFVLRNIDDSVKADDRNRIHPFYMVYVSEEGEPVCDYLDPKKLLDTLRLLCRGKDEPSAGLCRIFNDETDDGRRMDDISELLNDAINSIIDTKEESDIDSLFRRGGTTALLSPVSGLDNFELISFVVVK